jgi:hypothetical protein
MWIDTGSKLINLNKIALIYPDSNDDDDAYALHYLYYFDTLKDFELWLDDELEATFSLFINKNARDARYEEIKAILIKNHL